jgi:hypothetical protein
MFPLIAKTYALAAPQISEEHAQIVIDSAVDRARLKHGDFDRFAPGIEFLSGVFFTDHSRLPLDDYLEVLYCAVKHADFSRAWRAQLRKAPAAAPAPAPAPES